MIRNTNDLFLIAIGQETAREEIIPVFKRKAADIFVGARQLGRVEGISSGTTRFTFKSRDELAQVYNEEDLNEVMAKIEQVKKKWKNKEVFPDVFMAPTDTDLFRAVVDPDILTGGDWNEKAQATSALFPKSILANKSDTRKDKTTGTVEGLIRSKDKKLNIAKLLPVKTVKNVKIPLGTSGRMKKIGMEIGEGPFPTAKKSFWDYYADIQEDVYKDSDQAYKRMMDRVADTLEKV